MNLHCTGGLKIESERVGVGPTGRTCLCPRHRTSRIARAEKPPLGNAAPLSCPVAVCLDSRWIFAPAPSAEHGICHAAF